MQQWKREQQNIWEVISHLIYSRFLTSIMRWYKQGFGRYMIGADRWTSRKYLQEIIVKMLTIEKSPSSDSPPLHIDIFQKKWPTTTTDLPCAKEQVVVHLQISSIYIKQRLNVTPRKCQSLLTHAQFIHYSINPINTNLTANQQRPYSMVTNQHGEVTPLAQS